MPNSGYLRAVLTPSPQQDQNHQIAIAFECCGLVGSHFWGTNIVGIDVGRESLWEKFYSYGVLPPKSQKYSVLKGNSP